jgi:hypothetical protein
LAKTHKNVTKDSQCPGRDSNRAASEHNEPGGNIFVSGEIRVHALRRNKPLKAMKRVKFVTVLVGEGKSKTGMPAIDDM